MIQKNSGRAERLMRYCRPAKNAYYRAARYIKQKELKDLLESQQREREAFCRRIQPYLGESTNTAEVGRRPEEVRAIDVAVEHKNPFEVLRACIEEECMELKQFDGWTGTSNTAVQKILEAHRNSLEQALARLHTIESMAFYRSSESHFPFSPPT